MGRPKWGLSMTSRRLRTSVVVIFTLVVLAAAAQARGDLLRDPGRDEEASGGDRGGTGTGLSSRKTLVSCQSGKGR